MAVVHPLFILFVEDVQPDAELAASALKSSGLDFTWARVESAPDLAEMLKTRCPDLVLSDYSMPGFDGMQALACCMAHDPDLPFIMLTGWQSEETAVRCLTAGAWDYVLKERPSRLPFAVRDALARKRERVAAVKAHEALVRIQRIEAIGRLAGGVSHEFNNLLTGILGFCDLMLSAMPPDVPYRSDVLQIQGVALRASTLSRQLMAFSRQQNLLCVRLNVTTLVAELRKPLRSVVREHIQMEFDLAADLDSVDGDPGQIEHAIYSLVTNADDAMPDGGRLTIRTAQVTLDEAFVTAHPGAHLGRHVAISVADTGTGIDPRVLPTIFEPFVTTKSDGQGTGLGLAAVYGIVQQMGGYVAVESAEGQGSTLTMFFPVPDDSGKSPAPAPVRAQPRARTGVGAGETILLVEDDESLRSLLLRALEKYGYTVVEAADGLQAVERWRDHGDRIDLLITDIIMPGHSGPELVRLFRAAKPALPVLLMTGYAERSERAEPATDDRTALIRKPFLRSALVDQIRRLLDRPGAGPPTPSAG
jgi:two-component system cell cycle sensor histidine kinase/response regulator CckA